MYNLLLNANCCARSMHGSLQSHKQKKIGASSIPKTCGVPPTGVNVVLWLAVVAVGGHQLLGDAQNHLHIKVLAIAPHAGLRGRGWRWLRGWQVALQQLAMWGRENLLLAAAQG